MVTSEDRMKILRLLQEGRISPEAAAELLQALDREDVSPAPPTPPAPGPYPVQEPLPAQPYVARPEAARQEAEVGEQIPGWLRVRVTDTNSGKPRVNVRLPLMLVSLGLNLGQRYTPEIEGINLDELVHAARYNGPGPLVDMYDDKDGEHVEVFLE